MQKRKLKLKIKKLRKFCERTLNEFDDVEINN